MKEASEADHLARCQEALRQMQEEIEFLRNASLTFGELADRLNQQVQTLRAQLGSGDRADTERAR